MEKKTLFEIPIYSMSEKEFNKRWDKQKKSLYDTYISHGHSDEETRFNISNTCYPRSTWKYNQIVGYILSQDPTYITTFNNARTLICKVDRDDLLKALIRSYLNIK